MLQHILHTKYFTLTLTSQHGCPCKCLIARACAHTRLSVEIYVWLPRYVCARVCVCPWPCCYFAWWLNSKAVAEHRAVLGCHFSSFAGQRDSWAEGSIWAVRRWRESWCWVTDSGIEWLCPVRTPVVFMGRLALKWYIEGWRRMLHIYRVYSRTHTHTGARTQFYTHNHAEDTRADAHIGIHTYEWARIHAETYAARNVRVNVREEINEHMHCATTHT